jgi:hypothetical protein
MSSKHVGQVAHRNKRGLSPSGCSSGDRLLRQSPPQLDRLQFDRVPPCKDGLGAAEVDIGRGQVVQTLVVAGVVVVSDEPSAVDAGRERAPTRNCAGRASGIGDIGGGHRGPRLPCQNVARAQIARQARILSDFSAITESGGLDGLIGRQCRNARWLRAARIGTPIKWWMTHWIGASNAQKRLGLELIGKE